MVVVTVLVPFTVHAVLAGHGGAVLAPARILVTLQVGAGAFMAAGALRQGGRPLRALLALGAMTAFLLATILAGRGSLVAAAALTHGVLYGGVCWAFGASLLPGREALVSRLARRVEPCPTPALMRYTRGVTALWFGFGLAQLAGSALLLLLAPLTAWSAFVNLLDMPLVVLTFAAEYAVRRWRFRGARLATLGETVRAFTRRRDAAMDPIPDGRLPDGPLRNGPLRNGPLGTGPAGKAGGR